jgi:GTP-binding protein
MDPVADFKVIQKELAKYSKELAEKSQILAINKIDLLDEEAQEIIKEQFESDFK